MCSNVDDLNNRNLFISAKLLKNVIDVIKFEKLFLNYSISETIFYGDLVFKFKRIVRKPDFSDQLEKIIKRYQKKLDITWISCDILHAWL